MAKVTQQGRYYFHKDHLGSSTAMTDATGAKVETTEYVPYGEMREHTGAEVTNYKFTDQELDPEIGLYNYGARLYDPVIGRFITPDTIIPDIYDPQSLNRYSYCRNNPLIYTDPTGHVWGGGYTDKTPSEDKGASGGFSSSWGGGYTDKTPSESKAITGFFNAQIDKNVGKMGKISKAAVAIPLGLEAILEAPTLLGKIVVGLISGITIGYLAYKEMKEKAEEKSNEEEKRSNPLRGEPGSTRTLDTKEGNPKQDRTFKEDTYPEKDIDYDHPHKGIQPHAHDWGRPEDGSPPTGEDRGEGRDLTGDETTNLRDKKD